MMQSLATFGEKVATFLGERTDYGMVFTSPTLRQLNDLCRRYSLAGYLPYRAFDTAKGLFYNECGVGFVLETDPLVGSTEEMQREISGLFQHTLPENSNIQLCLWADPRIDPLLNRWRDLRGDKGEILKELAARRTEHLQQKVFKESGIAPLRNFRCIISYSQEGGLETPVDENKILQLRDQIRTSLKTLGVPVKVWTATDLLNTLDGIVNFNHQTAAADLKWNVFESLNQQIPTPQQSLQVTKNGLVLNEGESVIRTYSVKREPDHWSLHAMGDLIGDDLRDLLQIPCPFMIHYGIHICDQEKAKLRVQAREPWVERQAKSKIGKRIPIVIKQSRELDFVREQMTKGERFVQTNFSVTLFSPKDMVFQSDQVLINLYRSKRWQLQCNDYIQLPSFLSTLPMAWGEGLTQDLGYLQKLKTTLSTEAANLLPLQGEWKGTKSPGLLLAERKGQLFTWSPFDNEEGNYNTIVVGKSGSGKSVFMQEMVTSTLGMGGQVFILDVGRSFEKTVKLLGGVYIEFSPQTPLCINPFTSIPTDHDAETEDALAMLKPILSLMAAPKDGTNDLENTYIEQAIRAAWELKGQGASISDAADYLVSHRDVFAQNLGQKLYPYTKEGIYGRFFEGPATVDLSAKMVVIELEELKERKDLQEVIVQMVILQITNRLYLGDRKTPTKVVLDEAWDMLRGKQSGVFIETAARRFRKYFAALVVGTQSVNDFYATPAARAAFENSDWMCFLAQKAESIKQLKESKRIAMDPTLEAKLTSLRTRQGQYAEVMIHGPHGYAIGRLLLDPYSLILYSTKAEEFSAVQQLTLQGISLADAIGRVAAR